MNDPAAIWHNLQLPDTVGGAHILETGARGDSICALARDKGAAQAHCLAEDGWQGLDSLEALDREAGGRAGFDIIVARTALEGVERPALVAHELCRRLRPGGVLIAEVEIRHRNRRVWSLDSQTGVLRWLPSEQLLRELLSDFAVRMIQPSLTPGRTVWHMVPRHPIVTLISGESGAGKSVRMQEELAGGATGIGLDNVMAALDKAAENGEPRDDDPPLLKAVRAYKETRRGRNSSVMARQPAFASHLRKRGGMDAFVAFVGERITDDSHRYAIEGGILTDEHTRKALATHLENLGCRVWNLTASDA